MKTKNQHSPTIRQNIERLLAHKLCALFVLSILGAAVLHRVDSRVFFVVRSAYAQGFGKVSEYMREEPARMHFGVTGLSRNPTISGR